MGRMKEDNMYFTLTLVVICVFLSAIVQIIYKSGMSQVGEISSVRQLLNFSTLFHVFTNPYVLIGISLSIVSLFLWLSAMSTLNVSLFYPLSTLALCNSRSNRPCLLKREYNLIPLGRDFYGGRRMLLNR